MKDFNTTDRDKLDMTWQRQPLFAYFLKYSYYTYIYTYTRGGPDIYDEEQSLLGVKRMGG